MQELPFEFPSLAAKGHKQYAFSMSMARQSTGVTEEAGASVSSELKENEYTEVRDHIVNNVGKFANK